MEDPSRKHQSEKEVETSGLKVPEDIAQKIVNKYMEELKSLVRWQLNRNVRMQEGTSALVQDVFKSFFCKNRDFTQSENTWNGLLRKMIRNKCKKQVRKYETQKRDHRKVNSSEFLDDGSWLSWTNIDAMASGPSPEDAENIIEMIKILSEREQKTVRMQFEGYTLKEIAEALGCSDKTIQRDIESIRDKWECFR